MGRDVDPAGGRGRGRGVQDAILGGAGRDKVKGGRGHDRLDGGKAKDRIFGSAGADQSQDDDGILNGDGADDSTVLSMRLAAPGWWHGGDDGGEGGFLEVPNGDLMPIDWEPGDGFPDDVLEDDIAVL